MRRAPLAAQIAAAWVLCAALWLSANAIVQVARKPTELFSPVSGALDKMPAQTWRSYEPIFRAHATAVITPDFLAALAQVESAGNPMARTRWRWRLTEDPFDVYRPASSAVGMYQITNGTFRQARRYCIHDHEVVEDGPWHAWRSCWFNGLYFRVVPSHAAEMTSAFLDISVSRTLRVSKKEDASLRQQQDLAAIMHLCGVSAGEAFARRGFRLADGQSCGNQNVGAYLGQMHALQRTFARLGR
ncbi:MAG TPA: transglycosylase SLT domain-containing protein [Burkholderiales bacterium]|nr:transglycosylase SLT domain-containing protein [Burkholderiales bacterium]